MVIRPGAFAGSSTMYDDSGYFLITVKKSTTTSSTSTSSGYSNKAQQGGGASGKGQYPGTQSAGGNGNGNDGGFGYGGNQTTTGYFWPPIAQDGTKLQTLIGSLMWLH